MPNFTVRNIPDGVYRFLRRRAQRNRRSLNAEILTALEEKTGAERDRARLGPVIRELREGRRRIARKYPSQPDSAELIREDRENR